MKTLRNSDWLREVLLIPNSANLYYQCKFVLSHFGGKSKKYNF